MLGVFWISNKLHNWINHIPHWKLQFFCKITLTTYVESTLKSILKINLFILHTPRSIKSFTLVIFHKKYHLQTPQQTIMFSTPIKTVTPIQSNGSGVCQHLNDLHLPLSIIYKKKQSPTTFTDILNKFNFKILCDNMGIGMWI